MESNKYYRLNFSVPRKQLKVLDILDKAPNKSQFVVQAILEKHERDNKNINSDIGDILASALKALTNQGFTLQPVQNSTSNKIQDAKNTINTAPDNSGTHDDNSDLLKGMLSDLE